jgi:hypothetical protein
MLCRQTVGTARVADRRIARHPLVRVSLLLLLVGGAGVVLRATLPEDVSQYLAPALASIAVFAVFAVILQRRVGESVFGELGFLYVGLTVAYTVLPAFVFMGTGLAPLAALLPDASQLSTHLWRQVLFECGVASGYLLWRGRQTSQVLVISDSTERDGRTLLFVAAVIAVCWASEILLSAPVHSYYDNYVRYDHLPWLLHKLVSVSVRLSLGLYCVLLLFLFRNYAKYKWIIPPVVLAICAYEMVHSFGARIQALIVLLQAVCLYHFYVRKVSLKWGLIACVGLAALFSAVELVRVQEFDIASAQSVVAEEGLKPATEFGSVFFPGFHLYAERAQGALPAREWPMFFHDFISLFTFGDFTRWNPMFWYWRNYYPDAEVPPFTLGPIADSAMWGGEADLLVRAVLNGLFFAFLMRWFLRHKDRWWGVTIYVYCYATCILTLKYTVFLHLNLIEKNLVLTLLLVQAARVLKFKRQGLGLAKVA